MSTPPTPPRPECTSDRCWSPIACEANGFCRTERFANNPGREARLRGLGQIQTALLAASDLYESWLRDHAAHPSGNWQRQTWHLLGEALRYPVVAEQIGGAPESPAGKSHVFGDSPERKLLMLVASALVMLLRDSDHRFAQHEVDKVNLALRRVREEESANAQP